MPLNLKDLAKLSKDERNETIVKEFIKCKDDPIYCIENYFTVLDPALGDRIPFKLYSHQHRAVEDFQNHNLNLTMKTRQMGFTTIASAYMAWIMSTKQNQVINALSYEKKLSRRFLRQVKEFLDDARKRAPWLVPDYVFNNNGKDSFSLKTGSTITAEANKPDACRGEVINWLIIDEVAAITHMDEIWASAGITLTRSRGSCIGISTPKGQAGWYFEQYTHAEENGWNIIDAHWLEHPDFRKGTYQYVKDETRPEGGYIKFIDPEWPVTTNIKLAKQYKTKETYQFILDGKVRSPWYDVESKRLGPRKTKCELDCSFAGSGGEVIDSEVIRAIMTEARNHPFINEPMKGAWRSYKEYKAYNPEHNYILSADVATGDGSDYSAFVVVDLTTKELVATYKDQVETTVYSQIIAEIGHRYGRCLVIVEYQGPGLAVLMELKNHLHYTNMYHHTLKKADVTKPQKRKLGFWQGGSTRTLGGDKLEEVINSQEIKIYSEELIAEMHTWIWDKDGERRHAPGKHDDLIMALSNGVFYIYFVLEKKTTNMNLMKTQFQIISRQTGKPSQSGFFID